MKINLFTVFILIIGFIAKAQLRPDAEGLVTLESFLKETKMLRERVPESLFVIQGNDTLIRIQMSGGSREDLITVPYDYRSKQFTDLYKVLAFKDPNVKDTIPASMRYWLDDIRIYFSDEVQKNDVKGLSKFALDIAGKVDSLNISVVDKLTEANFIVYYNDHFVFEPQLSENTTIDFYVRWSGPYIKKAFLRVDEDRYFNDEERLQRLKSYFIRTLGYFNTTDELDCGSYFSNCSAVGPSLSALDLELLQYHYSYGVCKGVNLETYEEQLEHAEEIRNKPYSSFMVSHYKDIFDRKIKNR